MNESTTRTRPGRQKLCNFRRVSDISSIESTEDSSISTLLNRLIRKNHKQNIIQTSFTSFESIQRPDSLNIKSKSFESVNKWASIEHRSQTCRRKNVHQQRCTTNQKSHIEFRTVTSKTPTLNCNYRKTKKTYSDKGLHIRRNSNSYDSNYDSINNDTNNIEWYIQLASNCYRNGFQLHVNHLDKWSKHPCVLQKKPAQLPLLRLPSTALLSSRPPSIDLSVTISTVADLVVCSSPKSIQSVAPLHYDNSYLNKAPSDRVIQTQRHHPHQLNTNESRRVFDRNSAQYCAALHSNRPIDGTTKLPIIDITPIWRQQQQHHLQIPPNETEQINALNAKNNMNSVAVDANNLQQNLQLSCQAIQYNYQNNNLTFDRKIETGGPRELRTIGNISTATAAAAATVTAIDNNNYHNQHQQLHQYWTNESTSNLIRQTTKRHETRPTGDIVNDLIEAFSTSFDVSDANQTQLPQIILSDFSSNQPTPPTTPLFFAIQSTRTLSEHPEHLQEFPLSKPPHQPLYNQ